MAFTCVYGFLGWFCAIIIRGHKLQINIFFAEKTLEGGRTFVVAYLHYWCEALSGEIVIQCFLRTNERAFVAILDWFCNYGIHIADVGNHHILVPL